MSKYKFEDKDGNEVNVAIDIEFEVDGIKVTKEFEDAGEVLEYFDNLKGEINVEEDKISQIEQIFIEYDDVPVSYENDKLYLEKIREVIRE